MSDTVKKEDFKNLEKFYKIAGPVIGGLAFKILDFHTEYYHLSDEPFLLMSNHSSEYDSPFQAVTIMPFVRFVASDHLFVNPAEAKLLNTLAKPIIRHRDQPTEALIDDIKENIAAGVNVGINVEGRLTSNGKTGFISKRNAQLVKDCGCDLVTYRFIGGYMKGPKWGAYKHRKGPTRGEIVHIYKKQELAEMSLDDIYAHIVEDLYVNAYDEQRKDPHKYTGENLAEHAERVLYGCPKCQSIGHLHTKHNTISCDCCDFEAYIDDYGFWHGDMPFDNIVDWDDYQKQLIRDIVNEKSGTNELVFSDDDQIVFDTFGGRHETISEHAKLYLFSDRFEIETEKGTQIIPFGDIKDVNYASKQNLRIVTDDFLYNIDSQYYRAPTKYIVAYRYFIGKENY